jgi:SNF2 family DNA or RNA helicase
MFAGHSTCGECFQKIIDPSQRIREGDLEGGAKCPHCRGPLSVKDITDYRHFCQEFCPERIATLFEGAASDSDPASDSESEESDDEEADEDDDLHDFVVPDDVDDDFDPPAHKAKDETPAGIDTAKKGKAKARKDKKDKKPKLTLAQLRVESLRSQTARRQYMKRLRKTWKPSAKIDKTMELITEIHANDPTEKILIFSQFTSLLDLVEVPLLESGHKYQRYDGSMKMDARAEAVTKFMYDDDQQILLISLKAGNAGLNLNKASRVIILDPFWNPFVEDQAVDRAHRMPQQREVHVHRLLVPETVEDRIIALQDQKRELILAALDEKAGRSISRLGVGDLMYLFGMGGRPPPNQHAIAQ